MGLGDGVVWRIPELVGFGKGRGGDGHGHGGVSPSNCDGLCAGWMGKGYIKQGGLFGVGDCSSLMLYVVGGFSDAGIKRQ